MRRWYLLGPKEHMVPLSCSSSLIISLCHVCTGGRFPLKRSSRTGVVVLYNSIMSLPQKAKLLQKGSRARDSCASIIQSCIPWTDKINMKPLRRACLSFWFFLKKETCIWNFFCHMDACFTVELWFKMHRVAPSLLLERRASRRKPPTCGDHVPPGSKDGVTGFSHQIRNFLSRLEYKWHGALVLLPAPPPLFQPPTLICKQLLWDQLEPFFLPCCLVCSRHPCCPITVHFWQICDWWLVPDPRGGASLLDSPGGRAKGPRQEQPTEGVDANMSRRDWGDHGGEKIKRR